MSDLMLYAVMLCLFVGGFAVGIIAYIGYASWRATRTDGWDDSNMLNSIRLNSATAIHPDWFVGLYRLTDAHKIVLIREFGQLPKEPLAFIGKDEFEGNFPEVRP